MATLFYVELVLWELEESSKGVRVICLAELRGLGFFKARDRFLHKCVATESGEQVFSKLAVIVVVTILKTFVLTSINTPAVHEVDGIIRNLRVSDLLALVHKGLLSVFAVTSVGRLKHFEILIGI